MQNSNRNDDINTLNEFLKSEMSAVETYDQCIDKKPDPAVVQQLSELRQSHAQRVDLLRERIVALGGDPTDSSGMWGSFAKLVEGGAKALGDKSMLGRLKRARIGG
ncbi:DUF2383 domain-containing protein [Kineobactrum salinum]|uniref:DUF2383 domain-containing protein n=1 Tax=Kineobactrum salinum TaxID=2708301 RepID=A0A6C0U796_9GAMM|nr:DUF2383 domain-containing protein [Kineobactrum salinum]QIB67199.1 DUF2383 domain-containing protein [Kineobactrum salinum]